MNKYLLFSEKQQITKRSTLKFFFKLLKGGIVEIETTYPAGIIVLTSKNLKAAAEGENLEWGTLYPNFAEVAEEDFKNVARIFRMVAKIERAHEERYLKLLANVEQDKVYQKETSIKWVCRNCGYIHEDRKAPEKC